MEYSEYINLIIKQLSGTITPDEKKKLNHWLESDSENKKTLALFKQIWHTRQAENGFVDLQSAWAGLAEKAGISLPYEELREKPARLQLPRQDSVTKIGYRIMRYAAVILITVSLVYFLGRSAHEAPKDGLREIFVQYGKQNSVTLPDGSQVTLDAGSKLRFAEGFGRKSREVYLNGEAYFEVSHNELKPFIIYANGGVVTVLGTKFNVRAWQLNDREVRVVVVDGKVSFRHKSQRQNSAVVVSKGKMSYLAATHPQPSKPIKVDIGTHLAWMNRELILDNAPLNEVLDRLARWYDLQFKLPSPLYEKVKITGSFKKKSIGYILQAIGLMTQMDYKQEGKTVVFYKRKTTL